MADLERNISWKKKLRALIRVAKYRPRFTAGLVLLGGLVATLEGIGLGFIYPIIEVARSSDPVSEADGVMGSFLLVYETLGIPFTLEYLILGIAGIMTIRFTSSFLVSWLRALLEKNYEEELRTSTFSHALDAKMQYFDENGSDEILNGIITETRYSARVIKEAVVSMETVFLATVYLGVMFYIEPLMAIFAILLLGGITFLLRHVIEPAATVGTKVAEANEQVQQKVQAGSQGIRDVRLFGVTAELYDDFLDSVDQYTSSSIRLERNKEALQNFYDLAAALSLFGLIYLGFNYSGLDLGALAIFLFAMFRLSPLMSRLNRHLYNMENYISHLVRTQEFIDELSEKQEISGSKSISEINEVVFDDVEFSYTDDETVLQGISFNIVKGDFIGFVGQSGAGKSTIVTLLTRMYEHNHGSIRVNGTPIEEYDYDDLRSRIAVVRQDPYIFNDTVEKNITIGNKDTTREDVARVCEITKVNEFLDELPNGYESELGDNGVRLSGGQRQRVALARALIKDADFLVLDEATSDLDSSLERDVQAAIESMDSDYAIVAIAHRLSTIKNADRIYTLDQGQVIESGSHDELLQNQGEYAQLYQIQSRA